MSERHTNSSEAPTPPSSANPSTVSTPRVSNSETPRGAPSKKGTSKKRKRREHEGSAGSGRPPQWHTPWIESLGMTEYESNEQRLHDEIIAYVAYCGSTDQETRARALVISRVEDVIQRRFSNCRVEIFGSVALDLCLPGSDIDLAIQTPQVYDDHYKVRALFQLSSMLKNTLFSRSFSVAAGARVPIINFETEPTLGSFSIDISINANDGVKAVPIIKEYLTSLPPLRHLILATKGFLLKRGLHSASNGGLGSYALLCLIVCFLKLNPKKRPNEYIMDFMKNESLGVLLMDFLDFYGNEFDWSTSCLSPARGEILPKESMGYANEARPEALSIDCLVNPGCDVGKATSRAQHVRKAFHEAYETLKSYPLSMANCNILGTIIGTPEKTSNHRDHIQHVVDSGDLEANLRALQLPSAWTPPTYGRRDHDRNRGSHQRHTSPAPHHSYKDYSQQTGGYYAAPAYHGGTYSSQYPGTGSSGYTQPYATYPTTAHSSYSLAPSLKRPRIQY